MTDQAASTSAPASGSRVRFRDLGVAIGEYATGPHNAITDVPGVEVGHRTVRWGDGNEVDGQGPSRSGVTAIWPQRDLLRNPVAAGFFALAGTGEMTARIEMEELGRINTPIVLTNTMSVGLAYDAVCRYLVEHDAGVGAADGVLIPVVAECDDEYLHDVRGFHVTREHVYEALDAATGGPVAEGCVGSGTGMICFGFKGGIGSSSRRVPQVLPQPTAVGGADEDDEAAWHAMPAANPDAWTVGVLVMTNFGRRTRLTIAGVPVGRYLPWGSEAAVQPQPQPHESHGGERVDGSCIVIVATDAPLDGRQLARLAKRASLGLGRTGSAGENGSGEILMAFSTTYRPQQGAGVSTQHLIEGESINDLFAAAIDATEEAVLNSLCMAETTVGRAGRTIHALPLERLRELLAQHGRGNDVSG